MALKTLSDFHGNTLMTRKVDGFAYRELLHQPGVMIPKHSHERAHLGFVLRGVFTEDCEGKKLECKPLNVSFLPQGAAHSDDFRSEAHCFVLEFTPQRLKNISEYQNLSEPISLSGRALGWLTLRLHDELHQRDRASSLASEGLILEILAELSRQRVLAFERKPPRWLEQARDLIRAQFNQPLTHHQIAVVVDCHPVHLAREFRRHYGCTIGEYIRGLRIEFACRNISSSDATLAETALAAGFADQSHFSRVFKRLTGMTPAQFRANLRTR